MRELPTNIFGIKQVEILDLDVEFAVLVALFVCVDEAACGQYCQIKLWKECKYARRHTG